MIVSDRKAPEIDGKRKQYSGSEDRRIIPTTSGRFLPDRAGVLPVDLIFFGWDSQPGSTAFMISPEFPRSDRFLTLLTDLWGITLY
jgi:hypothetical protein